MADFLALATQLLTWVLTSVGSVITTIMANPILLIGFMILLISFVVGLVIRIAGSR